MHNVDYQNVRKPRGVFSTLAFGFSAVLVTVIVCGTTLILYGLNIVDRKSGNLIDFTENIVHSLPELADALPPAIADVLHDRRAPDYAANLDVSAELVKVDGRHNVIRPVVQVRNTGPELVSLLSMRVVVLDEDGQPVAERNEWAATPFAADRDWRGPLMPGATRRFSTGTFRFSGDSDEKTYRVAIEVTDVRLWNPSAAGAAEQTRVAAAVSGRSYMAAHN